MQKINYSLEDLDNFNIHKIREIARDVGVKSPASQNKNDLVLKIKKVVSGEMEPYFNKSKVGRPPKTGENFDFYNCMFPTPEGKVVEYNASNSFSLENFILSVEMPSAEYNVNGDKYIEGYIDIFPAGYGVVRNIGALPSDDNDCLVASILIREHKLRSGDFVCGRCSKIKSDKPFVLYRIENHNDFSNKTRKNFEDAPYLPTLEVPLDCDLQNKTANVFGEGLYLGASYFFHNSNMFNLSSLIASCFAKKGYKTAFLACNTKNTDILPVHENLQCLSLPYNVLDKDKVVMSKLFINKYKRIVEGDKNVIFVISGLSNLFRSIDLTYKSKVGEPVVIEAVNQVKRIISNAKRIGDNASLTIVIVDELNVPEVYKEVMLYDVIPNIDISKGQ